MHIKRSNLVISSIIILLLSLLIQRKIFNIQPVEAAGETASGYKLPWPAGQAYQVTGVRTSHTPTPPNYVPRESIDLGLPWKTSVLAMRNGDIVYSKDVGGSTNGYVVIDHNNGYCSAYVHLASLAFGTVTNGRIPIHSGQEIGKSGRLGTSGAIHLHIAVYSKQGDSCGSYSDSDKNREATIIFDEVNRELNYGDSPTSNNKISPPTNDSLINSSFESGNTSPWEWLGSCNRAVYDNGSIAHDGNYYLATNRANNPDCSSFYQDITQPPVVGETYRYAIWVRSPDNNPRQGVVALWARGGQEESNNVSFSGVVNNWQCFETSLTVQNSNHSGLRTEVYLNSSDGIDYYFDNAQFSVNGGNLCPDSPDPTPTPGPIPTAPAPSGEYIFDVFDNNYLCGVTEPTHGIIEGYLRTYSSDTLLKAKIRKCDSSQSFSQDGTAYIAIDGDIKWSDPHPYKTGDASVYWYFDPCSQFGICDENWHEYQAIVIPSPNGDTIRAGTTSARLVRPADLLISELRVRRGDNNSYVNEYDNIPENTRITFSEYAINCGEGDATDFEVAYYDNGILIDNDTEGSTVNNDCSDDEMESTTFTITGVGLHEMRACLDSTNKVYESNDNNNCETFFVNVVPPPTCYSLNMSVLPSDGGVIDVNPFPNCEGGLYLEGTQVILTSMVNENYTFNNWAGDASGTAPITTIVLDNNKSVIANFDSQSTLTMGIQSGWQLLSLPFLVNATTIETALTGINGCYDLVYAYDSESGQWLRYAPDGPPFGNTLSVVTATTGLWLRGTDNSCTFEMGGQFPAAVSLGLDLGWNLVSIPVSEATPVTEVIAPIIEQVEIVYWYDTVTGQWLRHAPDGPPFGNTLSEINPGKAYWIQVNEAITLPLQN